MWNRISGKSSTANQERSSPRNDRRTEEKWSQQPYSIPLNLEISQTHSSREEEQSTKGSKRSSRRGDGRDRGFNPTSTSYSSTSQNPYPGTANASVATASGNHNDEIYAPPDLVRNASLANQMPKSKVSRSEREDKDKVRRTREKDGGEGKHVKGDPKRESSDKRSREDKDQTDDTSTSSISNRISDGYGDSQTHTSTRGPTDFPDQIGAAGSSQFPGQYDGSLAHTSAAPQQHPMSSHVQDQFPGQFPDQTAAPYRPPAAASAGGPGLAAEYYGDAGESVLEQPGNRTNTPSLIVGAEPHLQPALAVAAPPPEPSATGGVGAAASFFSSEFDENEGLTSHDQHTSSSFATAPIRPTSDHHTTSASAIPNIGAAAIGAAAGYTLGSGASTHAQRPDHTSSIAGAQGRYGLHGYQRPPSPTAASYYSNSTRPPKPEKLSSHSSNVPLYSTGTSAAAHLSNHPPSSQDASSRPQQFSAMTQRHRRHGPFGALVDFFKDPEGVAQFEEYSEIVGICRYCFAPGSSPRDAPRKHHYRKRRSTESLGRVDKESRYYSSEAEVRRKKEKSWFTNGLAGYGLAKIGQGIFNQESDLDDRIGVKTNHRPPKERPHKSRRGIQSRDNIETGINHNNKPHARDSHHDLYDESQSTSYRLQAHRQSKSHSRDRKSSLKDVALTAAVGSSLGGSYSRPSGDHAPQVTSLKTKHKGEGISPGRDSRATQYRVEERSPERHRKSRKKKKSRSFFSLGNASSSSSVDIPNTSGSRRSHGRYDARSKDDKKAEAALLGLGAAAAALSLGDPRNGSKKKGVKQLVGVKETKDARYQNSRNDSGSNEEVWESAPEDGYGSADSALAYGRLKRRSSQDSLSSKSSGTDKWGWRWGSKKGKESVRKRKPYADSASSSVAGSPGVMHGDSIVMSPDQVDGGKEESGNRPLRQVFPVATSDPTRFDVGHEGSKASSNRPVVVPIQHPQPIAPVAAALYSSQAPLEHSYSASIGPLDMANPRLPIQPPASQVDAYRAGHEMPGTFINGHSFQEESRRVPKPRRRDTSPASFSIDATTSSVVPHRKSSLKEDPSTVRFDRTEEQEEEDRRERRRKRKEEKERRETREQEQVNSQDSNYRDKLDQLKTKPKRIDPKKVITSDTWVAPAGVGVVGATIAAAALEDRSKSEESKEERRERRRKEREREEADEAEELSTKRERRRKERERGEADDAEDASKKRERRSRRREREEDEDAEEVGRTRERWQEERRRDSVESKPAEEETRQLPGSTPELSERHGPKPERKEKSVWKEAASPKRSTSHEDYGTFFRPLDLINSSGQVKSTSAGTNADVQFDQAPEIVTVEPKGFRDLDAQPEFSIADTNDNIDVSKLSFPVPKLRLVEPTPPPSVLSTPLLRPKETNDVEMEEPSSEASPSKVTWGDDQTHEYTVISPEEEAREFIESTPNENDQREQTEVTDLDDRSDISKTDSHTKAEPTTTAPHHASISPSDDSEFAATLAASAEDAGFDPSIVINDPTYSRRDSPPGVNDQSMPGGFDDDESSRPRRKDKKKRSRKANSDGRDEDAVVKDIISQVEKVPISREPEYKDQQMDEDWSISKQPRSKKSKKGSKASQNQGDRDQDLQSVVTSQGPDIPNPNESPSEESPITISSAPAIHDGSRKPRKKSKDGVSGIFDADSTASSISNVSGSTEIKSESKEKPKTGLWNRVLGRSRDTLTQENGVNNNANEVKVDEFEEPKQKRKRSKGRKSTRDAFDGEEAANVRVVNGRTDESGQSSGEHIVQDSGRITQDLPTKVYTPIAVGSKIPLIDVLTGTQDQEANYEALLGSEHTSQHVDHGEPKNLDKQRPESFLGMRPEPPPPPDLLDEQEDLSDPSNNIVSSTARPLSEARLRQSAEVQNPESVASPTAVPFDFRFSRPRPPPGSSRSMSQIPFSSTQASAGQSPRPKVRPRSTEFTSFKEFRPLMLVERHNSHSEASPGETYPSLPSSRTTSRASSILDGQDNDRDQDQEMIEASGELLMAEHGLVVATEHPDLQSDLLDSQQTTPTAATFQHAETIPERLSLQSNEVSKMNSKQDFNLNSMALGALAGTSAVLAMHTMHQDKKASETELPDEERNQFEQGLTDMAPEPTIGPQFNDENAKLEHGDEMSANLDAADEKSSRKEVQELSDPTDVALEPGLIETQYDDPSKEIVAQEISGPRHGESILETLPLHGYERDVQQVGVDSELREKDQAHADTIKAVPLAGVDAETAQGQPHLVENRRSRDGFDDMEPSGVRNLTAQKAEGERQLQREDTQDAVNSWFAPISLSRKRKEANEKGAEVGLFESKEPIADALDSSSMHRQLEASLDLKAQEGMTPEMNTPPFTDVTIPATQNAADYGNLNPLSTSKSAQGPIKNPLDRRQSKSKVKKGKKGRKGALQGDVPAVIPVVEASSNLSEPYQLSSDILRTTEEKVEVPTRLDDALDRETIALDAERPFKRSETYYAKEPLVLQNGKVSPEAIPLPDSSDLDLEDGRSQHANPEPTETPEQFQSQTPPTVSAKQFEEQESPLENKHTSKTSDRGEGFDHEVVALDLNDTSDLPQSQDASEAGVPINGATVNVFSQQDSGDTKKDLVFSSKKGMEITNQDNPNFAPAVGTVSDAEEIVAHLEAEVPMPIVDQAIQDSATQILVQPQQSDDVIRENWAGFNDKKKRKKDRKAIGLSDVKMEAITEADVVPPMSATVPKSVDGSHTDNPDYQTLISPIAELSDPIKQEDLVGPRIKKNRKNGAKADQMAMLDVETDTVGASTPAEPSTVVEQDGFKETRNEDTFGGASQEINQIGDEWASFGSKKKSKKSKKGKKVKEIVEFEAESAVASDIPSMSPSEASKTGQSADEINRGTEELALVEHQQNDDKWAGLSSMKESTKSRKPRTISTAESEVEIAATSCSIVENDLDRNRTKHDRRESTEQVLPEEPGQSEDERAAFAIQEKETKFQKWKSKDLNLERKTLQTKSGPDRIEPQQPDINEIRGIDPVEATTLTSQEENTILVPKETAEPHNGDQDASEGNIVRVSHHDALSPSFEPSPVEDSYAVHDKEMSPVAVVPEAEADAEELDFIDRYGGDETPCKTDTAETLPLGIEAQELEIIDQYEEPTAAITNTAEEVKRLLRDTDKSLVPSDNIRAKNDVTVGKPSQPDVFERNRSDLLVHDPVMKELPKPGSMEAVHQEAQVESATPATSGEAFFLEATEPEPQTIDTFTRVPSEFKIVKAPTEYQVIQSAVKDPSEAVPNDEATTGIQAMSEDSRGASIKLDDSSSTTDAAREEPKIVGPEWDLPKKGEKGILDSFDHPDLKHPSSPTLSEEIQSSENMNVQPAGKSFDEEIAYLRQPNEDAVSDETLPVTKKGKKSKMSKIESLTSKAPSPASNSTLESEPSKNLSNQPSSGPSNDGDEAEHQPLEPDWDMPKRKKGKKNRRNNMDLDELGSGEPSTTVMAPADAKDSDFLDPFSANFKDLPSKKSKKDRKSKGEQSTMATSDDVAATSQSLESSDTLHDPVNNRSKLEPVHESSSDKNVDSSLEAPEKDTKNAEFKESNQRFRLSDEVVSEETLPSPPYEQIDTKGRKKKKGKRGKALAWRDEESAWSSDNKATVVDSSHLPVDVEPPLKDTIDLGNLPTESVDTVLDSDTRKTQTTEAETALRESEGISTPFRSLPTSESQSQVEQRQIKVGEDTTRSKDNGEEVTSHFDPNSSDGHAMSKSEHHASRITQESTGIPPTRSEGSDSALGDHQSQPAYPEVDAERPLELGIDPAYENKQGKKKSKKHPSSIAISDDVQQKTLPSERERSGARLEAKSSFEPALKGPDEGSSQDFLTEEVESIEVVDPNNRPFANEGDTKPETVPVPSEDMSKSFAAEEADLASVSRSQKGKKSKKGKQAIPESVRESPPLDEPTMPPSIDAELGGAEKSITNPSLTSVSKATVIPGIGLDEPLDPSGIEVSKSVDPENINRNVPVKKSKRSEKQQRKSLLKDQRDLESKSPPLHQAEGTLQTSVTDEPDSQTRPKSSEDDPALRQEVNLPDQKEQQIYDQDNLKELQRQDLTTPRSFLMEDSSILTANEQPQSNDQRSSDSTGAHDDQKGYTGLEQAEYSQESNSVATELQESSGAFQDQAEEAIRQIESPGLLVGSPSPAEPQSIHRQDDGELHAQGDSEASQISTGELPTQAAEVELLDAEQQREYDNAYAKELERQLSPPQEGEGYTPLSDDIHPMPSAQPSAQPSIDSSMTLPFGERMTLARPPPLDDIAEESRSRSSSAQEMPPDKGPSFPSLKTAKKNKKGKKGKKQRQPVIWEDDTATPAMEDQNVLYPEQDQANNRSTGALAGISSHTPLQSPLSALEDTRLSDQPIELEESIAQSPVGESNETAPPDSLGHAPSESKQMQGDVDDYFASRPDKHAEEDVGADLEHKEFRRSIPVGFPLSTEESSALPRESAGREGSERSSQAHGRADTMSLVDDLPSEAASPSLEEVPDDDYSYASTKKNKKAKKLKKSATDDGATVSTSKFGPEPPPRAASEENNPGKVSFLEENIPQYVTSSPLTQQDETSTSTDLHTSTEAGKPLIAGAAAGLGAAALAEDSLSRRETKKGGKKGKKDKRSNAWADTEEASPSSASPILEDETTLNGTTRMETPAEHAQIPRESSPLATSQNIEDGLPPSLNHAPSVDHAPEISSYPGTHHPSAGSTHRDSGITVSDSPLIPEDVPSHSNIRDSGYPETISSPIVGSEPAYKGNLMESDDGVTHGGLVEVMSLQDSRNDHTVYSRSSSKSPPSEVAEKESTYDALLPNAKEKKRRSKSYDSDDSADSGFDIQRRRRRQAKAQEARDPSPVSSTTKARSSALFDSSPSAREETASGLHPQNASLVCDPLHQEPTWSFAHESSPTDRFTKPQSHIGDGSSSTSTRMPDPSTYAKLTGGQEESPPSLFGGPVHQDEDFTMSARSPPSSESGSRQRRLGTISEDSHERSSLHEKDKRALSDVGSPEAGVKGRRVQSPITEDISGGYPSIDHSSARSLRSSTDDGEHTVKLERGRDREALRVSSRQSQLSESATLATKQTLGEHRTASVGSVQSDNSIHAIIRTPDQVRSASGQSYRSSGTPPLRRVDRSASGDLRGASKLGEAKIRAKLSEADLDPTFNNIPSSSTYDPVADKGKSRADMADVYVSTPSQ